ncbi:MAG: DUF411 domain-containing protein [Gemmatimonadaceae bacterium]
MIIRKHLRAAMMAAAVIAASGCSKGSAPPADTIAPPNASPVPSATPNAGPVTLTSTVEALIPIKVYKDANCGCCKEWVKHLEANGFKVETMDMPDLSLLKQKYGVKEELQACHTAIVGGYVVEGHVPADVIKQMLKEKPAVAGVAVPGMPQGSPGMESATKERYNVLTFDRAGRTTVYAQR